jgi:hypothetical protein
MTSTACIELIGLAMSSGVIDLQLKFEETIMIHFEDLLQKDSGGFPTNPDLHAPIPDLHTPIPVINYDNDKVGVKLTIPAIPASMYQQGTDEQECLLCIKVSLDQPFNMAASVNCGPDDAPSFTIKKGSKATDITAAPGAFANAVYNLRLMNASNGFQNGPAYLFYGLYPQGILSETMQVTLDFPKDL